MRLIPIHCDPCGRSSLIRTDRIVAGVATCTVCGGTARTVPGASYALEDQALYEELATALREASVSPANASRLMADLREHGAALSRLAKSMPSLAIVQQTVASETKRARKIDGMLLTLLEALASSRPPPRGQSRTD